MTYRIPKLLVLVVSLSAFTRASVYSNCCNNCDVSADKKAQYDALLQLSDAKKAQAEARDVVGDPSTSLRVTT
jgi:hypothetical protein